MAGTRVRAGVPDILIHDLRRTAVRNMMLAGIPEKLARLIRGYKDEEYLRRYTIIDETYLDAAREKMTAFEILENEVRAKVRAVARKEATVSQAGNAYNV